MAAASTRVRMAWLSFVAIIAFRYTTSKKIEAAVESSQKEIDRKQQELSKLQAKIKAFEYIGD